MQSSQELSTTTSSFSHEESDGQGSIAPQSDTRKRRHSKISADSDEGTGPNYDILKCFPPLLCRYVFSHFNAKQTLEMSTVNREWNKFVGESPQAWKLKVVVKDYLHKQLNQEVKSILMNSQRKYQKIEIGLGSNELEFALPFLAKRAGSWKYVKIIGSKLVAPDKMLAVLQLVEPSVEHLDISISNVYQEAPLMTPPPSWTFPKLKILSILVEYFNVFQFLVHVSSLKRFLWRQPISASEGIASSLQTIMRNNKNLEIMQVRAYHDDNYFMRSSEVEFKLQKLEICINREVNSTEHLLSLLTTQAETLEWLSIEVELDQALVELILNMPRLKALIINSISDELYDAEFKENSTIVSFAIKGPITSEDRVRSEKRLVYQKLITAMLSLQKFICKEIDDELFLCLLDVPGLRSIKTGYFSVHRVPKRNVFPYIREFKASKFRGLLQAPTADHNFAKLVIREMRTCHDRFYSDSDSDDQQDYEYF